MSFLTEDLISSIKLRSMMPVSQNTFTEAHIVSVINEKLYEVIVPEIMRAREDFFLTTEQKAITSSVPYVGLPARAIANAIKTIHLVDSALNIKPFAKGRAEDRDLYQGEGEPELFYFEGDEIRLLRTPNVSGWSVEYGFYQRPNQIVATDQCAKITGVSSLAGTTTFTVDTDMTDSELDNVLTAGSLIDIQSSTSPFLLWSKDVAITAITTTTIAVLTSDVANEYGTVEPQVGDYLALTQTANKLSLPIEFNPWVCQEASLFFLEALGHMDKLAKAQETAVRMKQNALSMILNRVETQPEVIVKRNGFV